VWLEEYEKVIYDDCSYSGRWIEKKNLLKRERYNQHLAQLIYRQHTPPDQSFQPVHHLNRASYKNMSANTKE
jgi:hypothetical protein